MDEVKEVILNGMSFGRFIGMYICSIAGVLVFFLTQVYNSVKYDKRSPDKFSFIYLLKTASLRIGIGLIVMWAAIVYYGELSVKLLSAAEPLAITGFVAFLMGIGIDALIKGVLEIGKNSTKMIKGA